MSAPKLKPEDLEHIAAQVRVDDQGRRWATVTQVELAQRLGVTHQTISLHHERMGILAKPVQEWKCSDCAKPVSFGRHRCQSCAGRLRGAARKLPPLIIPCSACGSQIVMGKAQRGAWRQHHRQYPNAKSYCTDCNHARLIAQGRAIGGAHHRKAVPVA